MYFDDDFSFFLLFGINLFLEYNPILSVLSLIMIYTNSTLILSILNYEYIAAVLLLIYVGAISILILFIIMMYQINETEMDNIYNKQFFKKNTFILNSLVISTFFFVLDKIILLYYQYTQYMYSTMYNISNEYIYSMYNENLVESLDYFSNINNISDFLYTMYMYPLLIAAVFLFFVVIICINLILKHK